MIHVPCFLYFRYYNQLDHIPFNIILNLFQISGSWVHPGEYASSGKINQPLSLLHHTTETRHQLIITNAIDLYCNSHFFINIIGVQKISIENSVMCSGNGMLFNGNKVDMHIICVSHAKIDIILFRELYIILLVRSNMNRFGFFSKFALSGFEFNTEALDKKSGLARLNSLKMVDFISSMSSQLKSSTPFIFQ